MLVMCCDSYLSNVGSRIVCGSYRGRMVLVVAVGTRMWLFLVLELSLVEFRGVGYCYKIRLWRR